MACKRCGVKLNAQQKQGVFVIEDVSVGPYCETCWPLIKTCSICDQPKEWQKDIKYYGEGLFVCNSCKDTHIKPCEGCGEESMMNKEDPESGLCGSCFSQVFKCEVCNQYHLYELTWLDNQNGNAFEKRRCKYPGIYKKHRNAICIGCFTNVKHRFKKLSVHQCKRCDSYFNNPSTNREGKPVTSYCKYCWENYAFECGDCGKVHVRTNKTLLIRPDPERSSYQVCNRCACKYYNCGNCKRTHTKKEMPFIKTGKGVYICYECSCKPQCSKCGKYKQKKEMSPTKNLCSYCYGKMATCSKCGTRTLETVMHSKLDKYLCRKCSGASKIGQLWNYMHKPYPIVHGNPDDLIFGFENEMSYKAGVNFKKVLGQILPHYEDDFLIAKYDSSVFNGFEIVTNPMTFEYFNSIDWTALFASPKLMSAVEVEKQNYYNESKQKFQKWTGFHCHLSKDHFHTHHLYKFMNFIYNNSDFVERVSERKANDYCPNFPNYKAVKYSSKEKHTKSRTGIYMPNKTITVELRFFAGCHTEAMLRKNIEFIQSLYEFTLDASRDSSMKQSDYLAYVTENRDKFSTLTKFLGI